MKYKNTGSGRKGKGKKMINATSMERDGMESFIAETEYTPESKRNMQERYEACIADGMDHEEAEDYVTPTLSDLVYNPKSGEYDIVDTPDDLFNRAMASLPPKAVKKERFISTEEINSSILNQLDDIHEVLQLVKEGVIDYERIGRAINIVEYVKEPFLSGLLQKTLPDFQEYLKTL